MCSGLPRVFCPARGRSAAPCLVRGPQKPTHTTGPHKKTARSTERAVFGSSQTPSYDAAALGMRLRELRWKNSAWLATADTIAGWNGFDIRNAGSGRSPVRKRSG